MGRKVLSIFLVSFLVLSYGFNVKAGSASDSGWTSGGSGIYYGQRTVATASLSVNTNYAVASTGAGTTDGITLATSCNYYYTDSNGHILAVSGSGLSSVTVGAYNGKGVYATSQHSVNGGIKWGSWSCSLSAGA